MATSKKTATKTAEVDVTSDSAAVKTTAASKKTAAKKAVKKATKTTAKKAVKKAENADSYYKRLASSPC